jgi:hypothetical protein
MAAHRRELISGIATYRREVIRGMAAHRRELISGMAIINTYLEQLEDVSLPHGEAVHVGQIHPVPRVERLGELVILRLKHLWRRLPLGRGESRHEGLDGRRDDVGVLLLGQRVRLAEHDGRCVARSTFRGRLGAPCRMRGKEAE